MQLQIPLPQVQQMSMLSALLSIFSSQATNLLLRQILFQELFKKHLEQITLLRMTNLVLPLVDNVWVYTSHFSIRSKGRLGLLVSGYYKHETIHKGRTIF